MRVRKFSSAFIAIGLWTAGAAAQAPDARMRCEDWGGRADRYEHHCEVRELTIPATGALAVDAGPNGGVRVAAWDQDEVLVRAIVHASAEDEATARELASNVEIETSGIVRASGPATPRRSWWSVSYEIFTPRATDLDIATGNGGISVEDVRGTHDVEAQNGGLRLAGVAGNVRGRTTNGGLDVTLTGDTWEGEALDVRTTNGGIELRIPEDYSARLETRTVNGGVHIEFPVTVQGRISPRDITTTLGDGGPLVRAATTNGGVRVRRY